MQSNPIAEAWKANPLCREDFVKNILLRFYMPLIVGLVEEAAKHREEKLYVLMNEERMIKRIQRKREKGWRKPKNAVYIGRGSYWGNPFRVGKPYKTTAWLLMMFQDKGVEYFKKHLLEGITPKDIDECFDLYKIHLETTKRLDPERFAKELERIRGKDLMCWCAATEKCHGDILIEYVK